MTYAQQKYLTGTTAIALLCLMFIKLGLYAEKNSVAYGDSVIWLNSLKEVQINDEDPMSDLNQIAA